MTFDPTPHHIPERPDGLDDSHLAFLDSLRESGTPLVNMYGAPFKLQEAFGLDRKTSLAVIGYWAETFDDSRRPARD